MEALATDGVLSFDLHPKQGTALLTDATEVGYGGAAGGGKMLSLSTHLPTPNGYVQLKDLKVGDKLFDENGKICTVKTLFAIEYQPKSYRLTFDNHTQIDACADHLWKTFDTKELVALTRLDPDWRKRRQARRASKALGRKSTLFTQSLIQRNKNRQYQYKDLPSGSVRTTQQIFETLRAKSGRTNHAIKLAEAIELPSLDLPIDPYLLGAWLGDGSSDGGGITGLDAEVWQQFEKAGFKVAHGKGENPRHHHVYGFIQLLRGAGLLNNKHVPIEYLRASIEQRLALLQGLMDTDGTCDKDGSVQFTNTNENLSDSVFELASSLGWKAFKTSKIPTCKGKKCARAYNVKFSPDKIVFRIQRKIDRQKLVRRRTNKFHYIVDCQPIDPMPMRCIEVDSPSHLFLVSNSFIPTHNSHLGRISAIYFCYVIPGLQVFLFRRQHNELVKNHMIGPTSFPALLAQWNRAGFTRIVKDEIRFANGPDPKNPFEGGSRIYLCHCQHEKDVFNWLGPEMHYLIIEQAEQFSPFMIQMLRGRNRIPEALNIPDAYKALFPRVLYTFNPGGIGHAFFKQKFVKGLPRSKKGISQVVQQPDDEGGKRRQFIQAKLDDNPSVNPTEYRKTLRGLPPRMAKALEEGDFEQVIGAFFPEISRAIHVIKPFAIPAWWTRLQAMDWGACGEGDPFSVGWWCVVSEDTHAKTTLGEAIIIPRGSIINYRKWYGKGLPKVTASLVARGILQRERAESIVMRVAGGDISNKAGHGESIFEIFSKEGVHYSRADRRRPEGHAQFRERLVGRDEQPRIYWFEECEEDLETIMNLQHDLHNPNDCTEADDHVYEQTRYMCMARPWETSAPTSSKPIEEVFKAPTIDEVWARREQQRKGF